MKPIEIDSSLHKDFQCDIKKCNLLTRCRLVSSRTMKKKTDLKQKRSPKLKYFTFIRNIKI